MSKIIEYIVWRSDLNYNLIVCVIVYVYIAGSIQDASLGVNNHYSKTTDGTFTPFERLQLESLAWLCSKSQLCR